jgi:hypothetical protein
VRIGRARPRASNSATSAESTRPPSSRNRCAGSDALSGAQTSASAARRTPSSRAVDVRVRGQHVDAARRRA